MAGRRRAHNVPPQWELPIEPPANKTNGHKFGRVYVELLETPNFQRLNKTARLIYITMLTVATSKEFHLTEGEAEKLGYSKAGFKRAVQELIEAGFIRIKRSGRLTREANIYEFTFSYELVKGVNKNGKSGKIWTLAKKS